MVDVSIAEILEVLRQHSEPQEGGEGWRVEELVERTGKCRQNIERQIRKALAAGKIERTERRIRDIRGFLRKVTAYKVKDGG